MKSDDARALLQSTQNLRTLWASVISRNFVCAVALNAAIWSYFLKAYIESSSSSPANGLPYLAVAAGLTSILLGWWRLYNHYIYNHIASLYPDLLLCEKILGIEPDRGTAGHLVRTIPRLRRILTEKELNPDQKGEAIAFLAAKKSLGRSSHIVLDIIVLGIITLMFVLCISVHAKLQFPLAIGTLIATIIGFLLIVYGIFTFQRYPPQAIITLAITKYGEE